MVLLFSFVVEVAIDHGASKLVPVVRAQLVNKFCEFLICFKHLVLLEIHVKTRKRKENESQILIHIWCKSSFLKKNPNISSQTNVSGKNVNFPVLFRITLPV